MSYKYVSFEVAKRLSDVGLSGFKERSVVDGHAIWADFKNGPELRHYEFGETRYHHYEAYDLDDLEILFNNIKFGRGLLLDKEILKDDSGYKFSVYDKNNMSKPIAIGKVCEKSVEAMASVLFALALKTTLDCDNCGKKIKIANSVKALIGDRHLCKKCDRYAPDSVTITIE